MKLNYAKGAPPLYIQIKNHIKEMIESKEYKKNEIIPGELDLEKKYKVSRITVRQAILELEKEGYVSRHRGKGTKVIYDDKINEFLYEIKSFTKEMEDRGITPSTKSVTIKKVEADELTASIFDVQLGDTLYVLERVRCGDGIPIVYFHTYLPGSYDFPLEPEKYQESMYEVFDEVGIRRPVRVHETFEARLASADIADKLEVQPDSPIFFRERTSFDEEGQVIEYSLCYYPGERYSYSVDLSVRG
ncbi:hypothetical protein A4S06_07335 [Erysipelotrichaceae bacterium MTC7]|nr:hypothetical protein A4S06_07335 [Erysipelotrichaceae bacterium MTC7]